MVVFTCQHCGESLRKNAVEKHHTQTRCRNKHPNLTCVDCLKDFFGDDYIGHISCLTEDQKYAAKGTVFKEAKGKKKQEQYTSVIQHLVHTADVPPKQKQLLRALQNSDNVPRKLKGFNNFLLNNNQARNMNVPKSDITAVFHLIENEYAKVASASKENGLAKNKSDESKEENMSPNKQSEKETTVPNEKTEENGQSENIDGLSRKELKKKRKHEKYLKELESAQIEIVQDISMEGDENSHVKKKKSKKSKKNKLEETSECTEVHIETNGVTENDTKPKKSKKRKLDSADNDEMEEKKSKLSSAEVADEEQTNAVQTSFDWSEVIIRVLESRPEKELALKKLAKKVVNEYLTVKPDHHTYEELMAKFNKKVKKTRTVRVLKDRAKLVVVE